MHSCKLITNLRAKKVLCHRIEVVRISGATTTDCVFCNVIGCRWIPPGKTINLMKPEELAEGHQTLFSSWEGGVWARDQFDTCSIHFIVVIVSCPDPTRGERVWWHGSVWYMQYLVMQLSLLEFYINWLCWIGIIINSWNWISCIRSRIIVCKSD